MFNACNPMPEDVLMYVKILNLVGQRFGRRKVIAAVSKDTPSSFSRWKCVCDCGTKSIVKYTSLLRSKSCGCLAFEANSLRVRTHGMSNTRAYRRWRDMVNRCENKNVKSYPSYGGRGIKVCNRWRMGDGHNKGFECFLEDMGDRTNENLTIDRIDVNGDYSKENCRWATREIQGNNKRATRFIIYQGKRVPLCIAVRAAGSIVHHEAVWIRIKTGWDVQRALTTPKIFESPNSASRRLRAR